MFVLLVALCIIQVWGSVEYLNIGPFYDFYDEESGERLAGPEFTTFGSARVHSSFVRLTPDRQSKHGALWSKSQIRTQSLTAILEFRLSGQGKSLFGDGLGLWFARQAYFTRGELHGFNEFFSGIGFIIDTYKNAGDKEHKDISMVVNDGETDFMEKPKGTGVLDGCSAEVRYHAKAHDFNAPFNTSRLLINIDKRHVTVLVDDHSTGDWRECIDRKIRPTDLDDNQWLHESHMGITAATGDLADNHDVISFTTYDNMAAAKQAAPAVRQVAPVWLDMTPLKGKTKSQQLFAMEERVNTFLGRLDLTEHHLEHEMIRLRDSLDHMIDRIDTSEDNMLMQIQHVEELMYMDAELYGEGMDSHYYGSSYGGMMGGGDDDYTMAAPAPPSAARHDEILAHIRERLDDTASFHKAAIEEALEKVRSNKKTWHFSYVAVVCIVLFGAYAGYQFFRLSKLHHLF